MEVGKAIVFVLMGILVSAFSVEGWAFGRAKEYVKDFYGGSKDMWRNYK